MALKAHADLLMQLWLTVMIFSPLQASLSVAFGQRAPNRAAGREIGRGLGSSLHAALPQGASSPRPDRDRWVAAAPRQCWARPPRAVATGSCESGWANAEVHVAYQVDGMMVRVEALCTWCQCCFWSLNLTAASASQVLSPFWTYPTALCCRTGHHDRRCSKDGHCD